MDGGSKLKFKRSDKRPYQRNGRVEIVSKKCAFACKSLPPIEDVKSNYIKQDARAKVSKEQVTSLVTKQSEREFVEAESDIQSRFTNRSRLSMPMVTVPPLSKLEPTQQRKEVRSQLVRKEVRRQLVRKKVRTHNARVLQRKRLIVVVEIRFGKPVW